MDGGNALAVTLADAREIGLQAVADQIGIAGHQLQILDVELLEDLIAMLVHGAGSGVIGHPHQQAFERLANPQARIVARRAPETDDPLHHIAAEFTLGNRFNKVKRKPAAQQVFL